MAQAGAVEAMSRNAQAGAEKHKASVGLALATAPDETGRISNCASGGSGHGGGSGSRQ